MKGYIMIRATSSIANRNRSAGTRADQRSKVVHMLKNYGPKTREALEVATGINGSTLRPVVIECLKAGKIRVLKARGKTKAGNAAELLGAVR